MPLPLIVVLLLVVFAMATAYTRRRLREQAEAHRREREELEKQHADALRQRGRQFELLVGRMIEALLVLDADERVVVANRAAAALFRFPASATGRPVVELVRHHAFVALLARLRTEAEIRGHELVLEDAATVLEVNAVRLQDERGEPAGVLLVFHDLTKLRRLEGLRQEFVANVSHELRTPLSLIKGAVETLLDSGGEDPAMRRKFLEIVDRHAGRLGLLIEDLLLLSALDSGRIELRMENVPLRDTAAEVLDDLQPAARQRQVTLRNEIAAGIAVRADAARLRQVFFNLVDNAIKYGREGGQVEVACVPLDGGYVQVAVRDDGPGIPEEARPRVFERFYRMDKARTRTHGGTGLGLAIVKNLVAAHGGDVRVESAEGRGTVFYFKLKAAGTVGA